MMTLEHPVQVSVVIPCYNYAKYVGQAIESALGQDYGCNEVIVVNDGSTDASLEVIRRFEGRVRIEDQENQGSIAAYNKGFALSRGDVIIFLDADDRLHDGALCRIAAAFRANPGCVKVQWELSIIDASGRDLGRRFCNYPEGYSKQDVKRAFAETGTYRWPVTVGNAYSRDFLERLMPLAIDHGPDGHLNSVAPVFGDVVTITEPLAAYRLHDSNMWATSSSDPSLLPERIRHRYQELEFLQRHARENGVPLPRGNPLDHEIAFLTYRLMARRLGLPYPRCGEDSRASLLVKLVRLLRKERYPAALAAMHLSWFGALSLCPPAAADALIALRAHRGRVRAALQALFGRRTIA